MQLRKQAQGKEQRRSPAVQPAEHHGEIAFLEMSLSIQIDKQLTFEFGHVKNN